MQHPALSDIAFDSEDGLLFSYADDLLLKAKAIQNSILPKLQVILQESIALVRKIYGIEVFDEDSTISEYPSFRENRQNELNVDYKSAFCGICPCRLPVWKKMRRTDKTPVKILPFRYGFELNENSLTVRFCFDDSIQLSIFSYWKLFSTLKKQLDDTLAICNDYGFRLSVQGGKEDMFKPLKKQLSFLYFRSVCIEKSFSLPTAKGDVESLPLHFAAYSAKKYNKFFCDEYILALEQKGLVSIIIKYSGTKFPLAEDDSDVSITNYGRILVESVYDEDFFDKTK